MDKKLFTVEEANALIPDLLEVVPRLQTLHNKLTSDFPDVRKAWEQARNNGGSLEGADYLNIALIANRLTKFLEDRGCVIKGIEMGLIDFPSLREGKEVYLCWKNPETEINFWHDIDSGFAGRQPI